MRKLLLTTAAILAESPVFANTIQTGSDRYSIDDGDERTNTVMAQNFCRSHGYAFADISWTKHGDFVWNHDTTEFLCLYKGQTVTYPTRNDNEDLDIHYG